MAKLAYYEQIIVRLDGKVVGKIKRIYAFDGTHLGYIYYPKGGKPGELFFTLDQCKQSLN